MNNQTICLEIWGRSLELEVEFDRYTGEGILETQRVAYDLFLRQAESLLLEILPEVKRYCIEKNGDEIGENEITNIFRYVKPKAIFVKRTHSKDRKVAIICAYKFNPEDGLAIVFQNEKFYDIGTENIII